MEFGGQHYNSITPYIASMVNGLEVTFLIVGALAAVVYLAFLIITIMQIVRSDIHGGLERLLWLVLVVAAPLLGSLAWWLWGSSNRVLNDLRN